MGEHGTAGLETELRNARIVYGALFLCLLSILHIGHSRLRLTFPLHDDARLVHYRWAAWGFALYNTAVIHWVIHYLNSRVPPEKLPKGFSDPAGRTFRFVVLRGSSFLVFVTFGLLLFLFGGRRSDLHSFCAAAAVGLAVTFPRLSQFRRWAGAGPATVVNNSSKTA
jgi:hypothetical protein